MLTILHLLREDSKPLDSAKLKPTQTERETVNVKFAAENYKAANEYYHQKEYILALKKYQVAFDYYEKNRVSILEADYFSAPKLNRNTPSIEYAMANEKACGDTNYRLVYFRIALCSLRIAQIHHQKYPDSNSYQIALYYYKKTVEIYKQLGSTGDMMYTLNQIADLYFDDMDQAEEYGSVSNLKALKYYLLVKNKNPSLAEKFKEKLKAIEERLNKEIPALSLDLQIKMLAKMSRYYSDLNEDESYDKAENAYMRLNAACLKKEEEIKHRLSNAEKIKDCVNEEARSIFTYLKKEDEIKKCEKEARKIRDGLNEEKDTVYEPVNTVMSLEKEIMDNAGEEAKQNSTKLDLFHYNKALGKFYLQVAKIKKATHYDTVCGNKALGFYKEYLRMYAEIYGKDIPEYAAEEAHIIRLGEKHIKSRQETSFRPSDFYADPMSDTENVIKKKGFSPKMFATTPPLTPSCVLDVSALANFFDSPPKETEPVHFGSPKLTS